METQPVLFLTCVFVDGENYRWSSSRCLSVQSRLDHLSCVPAAGHPLRGGEAAVDIAGAQLDSAPVSIFNNHALCTFTQVTSLITQLLFV